MNENKKLEDFTQNWLEAEPSVSAYVFASISGFHDAEDVVQRIAQELARRFDEYDSDRPFVAWALWISKSRVIDFYRAQGRAQVVFSDELLGRLADTIASQADGRSRRREALEACLDELPPRSRRLLDLRYVEELSAEETAREIGSTSPQSSDALFAFELKNSKPPGFLVCIGDSNNFNPHAKTEVPSEYQLTKTTRPTQTPTSTATFG